MNNARDFAEIIIAALLCATGGVVIVQALLAIERRRAVPSVDVHQTTELGSNESDISQTSAGSQLSEGMRNALGVELSLSLSDIAGENGTDEVKEKHAAKLLDFAVHRKRRLAASDLGAREAHPVSAADMYSKGA